MFLILSSFLFHSSLFISFLVNFPSFCASNESIINVPHLLVIIFSFIRISLIKILRERQDHPNYGQNTSPFHLCCCISLIGRKLDNFQWQIQGRGPGACPPTFETKLRPEGPKFFFLETAVNINRNACFFIFFLELK